MPHDILIFVHFPKASGSSLLRSFTGHFTDALLADYTEDPSDPTSPRNLDPVRYFLRRPVLEPNVRCVFGHFHPNKYRHLPNAFRATFLRHPIDNAISIYFYWKTYTPEGLMQPLHAYFVREQLSLIEMAQLPILRTSMSNTYFGGCDMSTFDFIGFFDRRTADLHRLAEVTGVPIDLSIHANKTSDAIAEERAEAESDPRLRAALADLLKEDIAFYDAMRQRFG